MKCLNGHIHKDRKQISGYLGLGEGGMTADGYQVSFGGGENVLKSIMVLTIQPCKYMKVTELYTLKG